MMDETHSNNNLCPRIKGKTILFVGAPGSGKTTQGIRLAKEFDGIFISTGDLFRTAAGSKSSLGDKVRVIIAKGGIVPTDLLYPIIEKEITQLPANRMLLFDFAGSPDQYLQLSGWLNKFSRRLCASFYLWASNEELFFRLHKRSRKDDTLGLIDKRLKLFYRDLNEILKVCKWHENFYKVNCQRNSEEISQDLIRYIRQLYQHS